MRVFEVKPCGSVTLEHLFIRNSEYKVSGTTVNVSIFPVVDESELDTVPDTQPQFDLDAALLLKQDAVYVSPKYTYALTTSEGWQLGIYVIAWEGTIGGVLVREFDKLYVVAATRQDIVDTLEMPSSINAGGVTIDYSARLSNMRSERGVRVGRLSKKRRPRQNDGDRDYDRI